MQLLELWARALKSDCGIAITSDNRPLLRQHLYQARVGHDEYDDIVMVLPEQPDEIWLVHRHASGFGANHQGNLKPLHD
jgi:hypothetical protein